MGERDSRAGGALDVMLLNVLLAMWLAAAAVTTVVPSPTWPARRLRGSAVGVRRRRARPGNLARWTRRQLLVAAVAGAAVLVGGSVGVVAAVVVLGFTLSRWKRRELAVSAATQRRLAADLPLVADLLSACVAAGATPETAAGAVAEAIGAEIGAELRKVTAVLRLGGDPRLAWTALETSEALAPLGRAFARAADTGAPLAELLRQVAADAGQRRHSASVAAARRVGVRAAAPLGLCFLPAFVLLAVVPVVAGLVRNMTVFE